MENQSLSENLSELNEVVKRYVDARLRYYKVILLEKTAKAGTFIFSSVVLLVLMVTLILLLSLAFSYWFAETHGSVWEGLLISAGADLVLIIIVYFMRKRFFTGTLLKNFGKMIFPDEDEI